MIPQAALDGWAQHAPWHSPLDIEQDLVLSRMITDIANHALLGEELAFRGGTSLHKLHLPSPWRYSNDLDYVRTTTGPVGDIMEAVRETALGMGLSEASYETKHDIVNMKFDADPTAAAGRIRIKVEINIRETTPLFDYERRRYDVVNPWYTGSAKVLTFKLEELLGTKLRALHQRRKGRDLFDLWVGLTQMRADPDRIISAFEHYLEQSGVRITPGAFDASLGEKLTHTGFLSDLDALLVRRPAGYTPEAGVELLRRALVPRMS